MRLWMTGDYPAFFPSYSLSLSLSLSIPWSRYCPGCCCECDLLTILPSRCLLPRLTDSLASSQCLSSFRQNGSSLASSTFWFGSWSTSPTCPCWPRSSTIVRYKSRATSSARVRTVRCLTRHLSGLTVRAQTAILLRHSSAAFRTFNWSWWAELWWVWHLLKWRLAQCGSVMWQWGLCEYVIVHTILPSSPVILWI